VRRARAHGETRRRDRAPIARAGMQIGGEEDVSGADGKIPRHRRRGNFFDTPACHDQRPAFAASHKQLGQSELASECLEAATFEQHRELLLAGLGHGDVREEVLQLRIRREPRAPCAGETNEPLQVDADEAGEARERLRQQIAAMQRPEVDHVGASPRRRQIVRADRIRRGEQLVTIFGAAVVVCVGRGGCARQRAYIDARGDERCKQLGGICFAYARDRTCARAERRERAARIVDDAARRDSAPDLEIARDRAQDEHALNPRSWHRAELTPKRARAHARARVRGIVETLGALQGGFVVQTVLASTRSRFPSLLLLAVFALACAPRNSDETLRKVHVEGVRLDPRTDSPVLELVEDGDSGRGLRIWIGEFEAQSIAQVLGREPIIRPNSHDLLKNLLERLEGQVRRTLVTELREGTFYAVIEVELHGRSLVIDARPSDAIAVALRTGAPVLVSEALLESPLEIPDDEGALDIDLRERAREIRELPSL